MKIAHAAKLGTKNMATPALSKGLTHNNESEGRCVGRRQSGRSVDIEALESAYKNWYAAYMSRPNSTWGTYVPLNGKLHLCGGFAEVNAPRNEGVLMSIWRGIKNFGFFPDTPVKACRLFENDSDALLSDWAIVGSDLYEAIQQYRIDAARDHAAAESTTPGPTVPAPAG
jgi:hypothetical protein